MKSATARELRSRASSILESVQKGEEVIITLRGEPVAVMKPVKTIEDQFTPVGFGIWKDREDIQDVNRWIDERRKERYRR